MESEGAILFQDRMNILGNTGWILNTEFSFNLLLSSRFALLPDIYKRFSSRDVKYQHVLAQEVVFSLEDLAKEK